MSVPDGTLTDGFRARLLEFYGRMLGWREIESLRLPDRLTVAVGPSAYINIRERPASMVTHGYEHFGVLARSAKDLRTLWDALDNEAEDLQLEPLSTNGDGEGSFGSGISCRWPSKRNSTPACSDQVPPQSGCRAGAPRRRTGRMQ